jgi:hypothetical protein
MGLPQFTRRATKTFALTGSSSVLHGGRVNARQPQEFAKELRKKMLICAWLNV